ncbi:hypothetical protein ACW0S0_04915, partial [Fusobacterium polymorphum]
KINAILGTVGMDYKDRKDNKYKIAAILPTKRTYDDAMARFGNQSVKAKLLEFGLSEDRIVGIEAMGEEQPIATNATKEGRAQNRRVEFK